MQSVKELAEKRHANKNISHREHPIRPAFFDDWTAIRAKLQNEAEAFILDATTLYASVNILLYFIIHLDTANAWGVGKVGAALHQNFIKLFIEPGFDERGLIDRSRNAGYILMPGQSKKDKRQVALFGGTGLVPDLILQPGDTQDDLFVRFVKEDGLTKNEASLKAYGRDYAGTSFVNRCKRLLGEI